MLGKQPISVYHATRTASHAFVFHCFALFPSREQKPAPVYQMPELVFGWEKTPFPFADPGRSGAGLTGALASSCCGGFKVLSVIILAVLKSFLNVQMQL